MSWSAFLWGTVILVAVLILVSSLRRTQEKTREELKSRGKPVSNHPFPSAGLADSKKPADQRRQTAILTQEEADHIAAPEQEAEVAASDAITTRTTAETKKIGSTATQSPTTAVRSRSRKV
ncbi:hypothetical protein PYCC9005_003278 [Savitreella phatthalungensis]